MPHFEQCLGHIVNTTFSATIAFWGNGDLQRGDLRNMHFWYLLWLMLMQHVSLPGNDTHLECEERPEQVEESQHHDAEYYHQQDVFVAGFRPRATQDCRWRRGRLSNLDL